MCDHAASRDIVSVVQHHCLSRRHGAHRLFKFTADLIRTGAPHGAAASRMRVPDLCLQANRLLNVGERHKVQLIRIQPVCIYCLFAFLAASAVGTFFGGPLGDRIGRKYVIWGSILGAAPFTLMLPYTNLACTIVLAVVIGLVISSAFSAILVYATDLMPGKVGMIAGVFFGLMFGLGGLGSAFFGWLADKTSIEYIFQISTLLPLLGVITGFLPNIESKKTNK